MANNKNNQDDNEMTLKEMILGAKKWISFLLSKWIIIIVFAIVGAILGLYYSIKKHPTYLATTTFVLEDEKGSSGLGNLAGLASMAGIDLGSGAGGIFQGDNILALYKSRTMIEKTLLSTIEVDSKKQLILDRYIEFNGLRSKLIENPATSKLDLSNLKKYNFDNNRDRLVDSLLGVVVSDIYNNCLTVSRPDKKISTIQVDVISRDEVFSKAFNDELVKNVNTFYINTKTKKTLANVHILQLKTDSVRRVMNGEIYSAVAATDATPNINPTRQVKRIAPSQRAQFSAETNKAVLGELVKNLELTKMALLKETPLIQVVDQPVYPLKVNKFSKIKGVLIGGLIFTLISLIYFISLRVYKNALES